MNDVIKLELLGRVGSGKTSVLEFIEYEFAKVTKDPRVNSISLDRALGVMEDVRKGLIRNISVKINSKPEPVSEIKNGEMALTICGNLSRSIKCQFMLDVIIPALTAQGITYAIGEDLKAHVSNPAVFPLDQIHISYKELYPRK